MADLDLDALAELERKATEGPWEARPTSSEILGPKHGGARWGPGRFVIENMGYDGLWIAEPTTDIPFIVVLRNHARTLIAEARRAREYRDALVKLIDAHGDHDTEAFWHVKAECRALLRREDERG